MIGIMIMNDLIQTALIGIKAASKILNIKPPKAYFVN